MNLKYSNVRKILIILHTPPPPKKKNLTPIPTGTLGMDIVWNNLMTGWIIAYSLVKGNVSSLVSNIIAILQLITPESG